MAPRSSMGLHFLAYNTHLFLGVPGPKYQDEIRMAGIIERIKASAADVVGLCEVWADNSKENFVESLKREFPYSYFKPNNNLPKIGSGLLLLSKHRILSATFTSFNDLVGADALSTKGVIVAKLLVSRNGQNSNLYVALSHTQSGFSANETNARWSNILQIWSAIRQQPYGRFPLVLLGDLNFNAEVAGQPTGEYVRVTNQFAGLKLYDIFRKVNPDAVSVPGYTSDWNTNMLKRVFDPNDRSSLRLDYAFGININTSSGSGTNAEVIRDYRYNDSQSGKVMDLSDHYPVSMTAAASDVAK